MAFYTKRLRANASTLVRLLQTRLLESVERSALAPRPERPLLAFLRLCTARAGALSFHQTIVGAAIKAMVESNVRGRWSARKYREARDLLLEAGFIREVTPAMATRPA